MKKFKRSLQAFLRLILISLSIIDIIVLAITGSSVPLIILLLVLCSAIFLVEFALVPDFEYSIIVCDNKIIFEFSKYDCRSISQDFIVTSITERYMVLEDGYSRIRIGYDNEVKKFLREIKISRYSRYYWFRKKTIPYGLFSVLFIYFLLWIYFFLILKHLVLQ